MKFALASCCIAAPIAYFSVTVAVVFLVIAAAVDIVGSMDLVPEELQ